MSRLRCAKCRSLQRGEPDDSCFACDAPLADAIRLPPPDGPEPIAAGEQTRKDHSASRIWMFIFGILSAVGIANILLSKNLEGTLGWTLLSLPAVALLLFIPIARLVVKLDVHALLKALVLLVLLGAAFIGSFMLLMAVCASREGMRF